MTIEVKSSWFRRLGIHWMRLVDPDLLELIFIMNQVGEGDIYFLLEGAGVDKLQATYFRSLSDAQLQQWGESLDRGTIYLLRILSAILFFRAAKHAKYFYEEKQKLVNLARARGRRITAPYYLRVMSSLNGTCAAWLKIKREARAYGRGVYGTFDYLGRIDHKTPRSAIRTNNKELKALICDELEPKFAILREQTDLMGKTKKLLKTFHFQTKKFYQ